MYCNYSQQWEIYDVSWGISEEANPDMHLLFARHGRALMGESPKCA